jgi:hypothetical protein
MAARYNGLAGPAGAVHMGVHPQRSPRRAGRWGGRRKHEGVHRSTPGKAMEGRAHRSGPASGRWHTGGDAAKSVGGGRRRCLGDLAAPWGQGGGEARRNQGGKWLVVALTDRRRWWRGRLQICRSWWQIPVAVRTRGIARSRGERRGASCGRMARQMGRAMKGALCGLNQGGEDKKENLVTWACDGSVGGSWWDAAPGAQGRGHILSWATEGTRPSGAHRGSRGVWPGRGIGHVGHAEGCGPAVRRRKTVGPKETMLFLN